MYDSRESYFVNNEIIKTNSLIVINTLIYTSGHIREEYCIVTMEDGIFIAHSILT